MDLSGFLHDIPLAPRTTLGVGGPARDFVEVPTEERVREVIRGAVSNRIPFWILGGGSNVVIADKGLAGLVIAMALRGIKKKNDGERVLVSAAAGEPWDALVSGCVEEGLAGLECLSGIPGLVGASPIQNVGAYGQEVSDCLLCVRAYDQRNDQVVELSHKACEFSYRESIFKKEKTAGRYVVLEVTFALRRGAPAPIKYAELARAVEPGGGLAPALTCVRDTVLALRKQKSMVIDPSDPYSKSAGSFFVNPVVAKEALGGIQERARQAGALLQEERIPMFETGKANGDDVKIPAAWLIERAGFPKGYRQGKVGLSKYHALALVNYDKATATEIIDLAHRIATSVHERFGVVLKLEPAFLGFSQ